MFLISVLVPSVVVAAAARADVRVDAQAALLHVRVAHVDVLEDLLERAQVRAGLARPSACPGSLTISMSGMPARFRSIAVDAGEAVVHRLARVLLHVHARDADADRRAVGASRRSRTRPPVASGWSNCEIW